MKFRFDGDAAPNSAVEPKPQAEPSIIEKLKLGLVDGAKSFMIDMWLARHTPELVLPLLHKVIDAAKEEFADAVANGGGIYGVGYCFGAKYILLLGGEQHNGEQGDTKKGPSIKAGTVAHGTQVIPADISAVTVPMSIICVEDDPLFPEEIRKAGEDALVNSAVEHEFKIYPGVPHGEIFIPPFFEMLTNLVQALLSSATMMTQRSRRHSNRRLVRCWVGCSPTDDKMKLRRCEIFLFMQLRVII
jgi:dienelactone hydrolase